MTNADKAKSQEPAVGARVRIAAFLVFFIMTFYFVGASGILSAELSLRAEFTVLVASIVATVLLVAAVATRKHGTSRYG